MCFLFHWEIKATEKDFSYTIFISILTHTHTHTYMNTCTHTHTHLWSCAVFFLSQSYLRPILLFWTRSHFASQGYFSYNCFLSLLQNLFSNRLSPSAFNHVVIFWERERDIERERERGEGEGGEEKQGKRGRERTGERRGGKESRGGRGRRKEQNASFDLISPCSYDLISLLPHSQK